MPFHHGLLDVRVGKFLRQWYLNSLGLAYCAPRKALEERSLKFDSCELADTALVRHGSGNGITWLFAQTVIE